MAYSEHMTVPGDGVSRAAFFKRSAALGGALVGGGAILASLPRPGTSAPSREQDARILSFLLELEHLQAGFYADALDRGAVDGELREFAEVVGGHERRHVAFLTRKLGSRAPAAPEFDFGDRTSDATRFAATTLLLEETVAAAYIGQGANLTTGAMSAAGRIVSVEARHAAWIRDYLGRNPAPRAADPPQTEAQVRAALRETGFVNG
jgi:hypothetical protein